MIYQRFGTGLVGALFALLPMFSLANADESALATSPAFASSSVEPNVAFLLDDSGSMRLGFMPDNLVFDDADPDAGESSIQGNLFNFSCLGLLDRHLSYGEYADAGMCFFSVADDAPAERQFLVSSRMNTVYYDPSVNYTPPPHPDPNIDRFPDANYNCAWVDGYRSNIEGIDTSCSISNDAVYKDLSDNYRAIMDDFLFQTVLGFFSDLLSWLPGVPERGGFALNHPVRTGILGWGTTVRGICRPWYAGTSEFCLGRLVSNQGGFYYEFDESAAGCDNPTRNACYTRRNVNDQSHEDRQNFANWFSYYRNRLMSSRAGIGEAFNSLNSDDFRVAWGAINHVSDMEGIRAGETFTDNREDFLYWLYTQDAEGGTPLRLALAQTADYFRNNPADVFDLECRPNHTLLMTDGYWNERDGALGGAPEFADASNRVAQEHGLSHLEAPFDYELTLADVAAFYWEDVLYDQGQPITTEGNPANWHHMITHGIGLGVQGTLSDEDYNAYYREWQRADGGARRPELIWRDPTSSIRDRKIDDLRRAALISRGEFFVEPTTQQFSQSLKELLETIITQASSASGIAVDSGETRGEGEGLAFNSLFWPNSWRGDLRAFDAAAIGGDVTPEPIWRAADSLNDSDLDLSERLIFTRQGDQGVLFEWDPTDYDGLSTHQQNLFELNGGDAEDVFHFIRGDHEALGAGYRHRIHRLGSIVHSTPEVVDGAASEWPNTGPFGQSEDRHKEFRDSINREPVVYVGANDGMLHGFDARRNGGEEILAYVPEFLMSELVDLARADYSHRYYVDLTPSTADIYLNNDWRTVLIGGARTGGRGIFALDVTDPSDFTRDNADSVVLWEFSHLDDDRMGYLKEPPVIALADWSEDSASTDYRWTAFFGNGYRPGTESTGLFMLDIESGANNGGWSDDAVRYIAFDETFPPEAVEYGLSAVTVFDVSGNGIADRVYAGDLRGNLWVAEDSSSGWRAADLGADQEGLLFRAEDASGNGQPITAAPAVTYNPSGGPSPNMLLFVGTGSSLFNRDGSSQDQRSFYGLRDIGTGGLERSNLDGRDRGDDENRRQTSENESLAGNVDDLGLPDSVDSLGWYMDLDTSGNVAERVVDRALIRDGNVYFGTQIPGGDQCEPGGSGWLMGVNFDGLSSQAFAELGELAGLRYEDGMITGLAFVDDRILYQQSSGGAGGLGMPGNGRGDDEYENGEGEPGNGPHYGRRAWREIFEE